MSNSYELLDVLLVGMFLASALFHIVWVYIIDDALKATTTYGVLSVTSPHYFELAAKAVSGFLRCGIEELVVANPQFV